MSVLKEVILLQGHFDDSIATRVSVVVEVNNDGTLAIVEVFNKGRGLLHAAYNDGKNGVEHPALNLDCKIIEKTIFISEL